VYNNHGFKNPTGVKSNLALVHNFYRFWLVFDWFWAFLPDRTDIQFPVKLIRLACLVRFLNHDNNLLHPYLKVNMVF